MPKAHLQASLSGAIALLVACQGTPPSTGTGGLEALYQERFSAVMESGGILRSYDPLEDVPGAPDYTPLPLASEEERTTGAEALEAATAYAEANNSSAFMVWHQGRLQAKAFFGEATPDTPLVSKSLSKPLSAVAIGRAIQLGAIESLDQPISDFITEWKGTPKQAMRVRHMLDMRSGLLAQGYSGDPDSPWNRAYLSPVHDAYLVESYPLTDTPGDVYAYSNAAAELVAIVIERATGQRYSGFIGVQILAPIGAQGGDIWIDRPEGLAHSGCCMHLPAESWLRLGILLLNDGVADGERLLPKGYVAEMKTATPQNPHYGLGVWVAGEYVERRGFTGPDGPGPRVLHSEPYLDGDLFLFDGNSNQVVYISQANQLVALRMGSSPPQSPEWDNSVLPNTLIRGLLLVRPAAASLFSGGHV